MFGRKAKAAPVMQLLDREGKVLQTVALADYILPEDAVLRLSREYFNDPAPCEIHRAAVRKRAMMELMERCPMGQTVALEALSELQWSYFSAEVFALRMEVAR